MSGNQSENFDDRRIWIGNLDTRLTEFQLLKIAEKCGKIEKFDILFHKSGPYVGQPRGYAFVTYKNTESAIIALERLNGKQIGCKSIVVRLAKHVSYDEFERVKPKIEIPVLAAGSNSTKATSLVLSSSSSSSSSALHSAGSSNTTASLESRKRSKQLTIQAIEAKLKSLENSTDDLEINRSARNEQPFIQRYQYNKLNNDTHRPQSTKSYTKNRHHPHGGRRHRR